MHTSNHAHTADLEATLDFLNTEHFDEGMPDEGLATADLAIAFFGGRGLAHEESLRAQAATAGEGTWLARVHAARGALRTVWDAQVEGDEPPQSALDIVNAVLREAPRIELVPGDGCCGIGHRHTADDPVGEVLARLAQPFVEAVAAGTTDRFRICANDGCRWVFEDTSRAGRRRWCDMSSCGNRAKVRRYRSKLRDATDVAEATPAAAPGGSVEAV